MKKLFSLITVSLIIIFSSFPVAADRVVSEKTLQNFLNTMNEVKALAENMSKEGREKIKQDGMALMRKGNFNPYTNAAAALENDSPNDYKKLENVVSDYGFSSVYEWAATGDDIVAAYMSHNMDPQIRQGINAMQNMTPQMLSMMPPQAKVAMQRSQAMMEAIKDVPPENVSLVASHSADIERVIQDMQK